MHMYGFNFSLQNRVGFRISINFVVFIDFSNYIFLTKHFPVENSDKPRFLQKSMSIFRKLAFKDLDVSATQAVRISFH